MRRGNEEQNEQSLRNVREDQGQRRLHYGGIGMHVVKNVKRTFEANLQNVKINAGGTVKTVKMCVRCIRTGNFDKA